MHAHISGGAYSWVLNAHHNAASLLSSLISVCGLIAVYCLLCLIHGSAPHHIEHTLPSQQRDAVTQYLLENRNNTSQEELSYCAFLLAVLPKQSEQRTREQVSAFVNLIISFGLGLMILIVLSAVTLICYPRRLDSDDESVEERRATRGFRLLSLGLMLRKYHVVSI